jgi:hypothetical protein
MRAAILICVSAFVMTAHADGGIAPGSARDSWTSATSRDGRGRPIIHSLRSAALELTDRTRFRFRIGVAWRFPHALGNGMPGPEDRKPMIAVDDAIHRIFERADENRIVYFTTGGGIREVMIYGTSEAEAWAAVDELIKQFPEQFPGKRAQWAYVKADPDWGGFRAVLTSLRPPLK